MSKLGNEIFEVLMSFKNKLVSITHKRFILAYCLTIILCIPAYAQTFVDKGTTAVDNGEAASLISAFLFFFLAFIFAIVWLLGKWRYPVRNENSVMGKYKLRHNEFLDVKLVSKLLYGFLISQAILNAFYLIYILQDFSFAAIEPRFNRIEDSFAYIAFYYFLFFFSIFTFLMWKKTALYNQSILHQKTIKSWPAIYWYFIPIFNLWKPFLIMKRIFNGLNIDRKYRFLLIIWWSFNFLMFLSFTVALIFPLIFTTQTFEWLHLGIIDDYFMPIVIILEFIELIWLIASVKLFNFISKAQISAIEQQIIEEKI